MNGNKPGEPIKEEQVITLRMLEANFQGIQVLLDYVQRMAKKDPSANRALKAFHKARKNEGTALDPSEAVFGFAAHITQLEPDIRVGSCSDASPIAALAHRFCVGNNMAMPGSDYGTRMVKVATKHDA